ncbi:MAG TPA: dTDP-4-dehydrorhamnose 3,5-epimerase family protein [Solirubrobacteraceae bacterium]|nr:dTDP-4-dehydrorhamnose 3,5-epimerase family protein [Solirubrobacteraceae bacterium]
MDEARRAALREAETSGEPSELRASVTPDGRPLSQLIDGVRIRPAVTHPDERGTLTEIFDPRWQFDDAPLVYVYQVTIRPGQDKGWTLHERQADRIFLSTGAIKVVLYDGREGSPTRGMLNEFVFGEERRALVRIPAGVWHALKNVGHSDAMFVNCPTEPYRHEDPDKWVLPHDNDLIPYAL